MSRTLFLDIDGVLMAHTVNVPSKKLGFSDWQKLQVKPRPFGWAGWYSPEQLALILEVFGNPDDRIVWLTTWELIGEGANKLFSDQINWKNHDLFPDDWLEQAYKGRSNTAWGAGTGLYVPKSDRWWKHDMVALAHEEKHEYAVVDEVVWVDDDMVGMLSLNARDMLDEHRPEKYTLIAPSIAWDRDSIESFRLL